MSIIKYIKNCIPIIFGILFIIGCFILSVFSFLGRYPFKNKSNELGIIFLLLFLFGFYFGMLIGKFITYLISYKEEDICLKFVEKRTKKQNNTTIKQQINTIKYIDF